MTNEVLEVSLAAASTLKSYLEQDRVTAFSSSSSLALALAL